MKKNTNNAAASINIASPARTALLICTILLSSCTANAGSRYFYDTPALSRAIEYHYFPNAHVYYDSQRHLYHYHHKQRGWLAVNRLPEYIKIDRHRRKSVHSKHRKPWKYQHLHKKHRSYFNGHDKNSLKRRHAYKQHIPRQPISSEHTRRSHEIDHYDGARLDNSYRTGTDNQRPGNGRRELKRVHDNYRPVNKITNKKNINRRASSDKQSSDKKKGQKKRSQIMQNKKQNRKSEKRREHSKQDKNRFARDYNHSRQNNQRKRN